MDSIRPTGLNSIYYPPGNRSASEVRENQLKSQKNFSQINEIDDVNLNRTELIAIKRNFVNVQVTNHLMNNKDINQDGFLTPDEFLIQEENFNKIDHNDDGRLSHTEVTLARRITLCRSATNHLLESKDIDEDGFLNINEAKVSEERFSRLDLNNDGQLEKKEINYAKTNLSDTAITDHVMKKKDTNQDGLLDLDETKLSEEKFNHIDLNSDGNIDRSELKQLNLRKLCIYGVCDITQQQQGEINEGVNIEV